MHKNKAEIKSIFSLLVDGEVEFPLILLSFWKNADIMGFMVKK